MRQDDSDESDIESTPLYHHLQDGLRLSCLTKDNPKMNLLFYLKHLGGLLLGVLMGAIGLGATYLFIKFLVKSSLWSIPCSVLALLLLVAMSKVFENLYSLHANVIRNDLVRMEYLLEKGSDVNKTGQKKRTALMVATARNDIKAMKLLLEYYPKLEARDERGDTALTLASHPDALRLLLVNGADVNAKGRLGRTALIFASEVGSLETAKVLEEHGADINAADNYGWTALMWASDATMAEFLVANGADIEVRDCDGWTPLMAAAYWGREDVARMLIAHGADVAATDKFGVTAKMRAERTGHELMAKLLPS